MTNAEDSNALPMNGEETQTPDQTPASADPTAAPHTAQPDDLHDLFEVPADDAEDPLAGLRNDPNYAALIRDLEYIAREARLLFEPTEEPSDSVWTNIQSKLQAGDDGDPELKN
jgi:hypothetical protein